MNCNYNSWHVEVPGHFQCGASDAHEYEMSSRSLGKMRVITCDRHLIQGVAHGFTFMPVVKQDATEE